MGLNMSDASDKESDLDQDGIPNYIEYFYGFDASDPTDASMDADNDGLNNLNEYILGLDPRNSDSDGDGIPDGIEVNFGGLLGSPSDSVGTYILIMIYGTIMLLPAILFSQKNRIFDFIGKDRKIWNEEYIFHQDLLRNKDEKNSSKINLIL